MKLTFIAIALSLLLLPLAVYGVGIGPVGTSIDFEPNLERNFTYFALNKEDRDINTVIYIREGPLARYATLDKTNITLLKNSREFFQIFWK